MSIIRNAITKVAAPAARRSISNSSKTNNAAVSIGHEATVSSSSSSSSSGRALKAIAYTVLGSATVVAGVSHLLKDEVIYWTPNTRK
ncbi:hypothetical protein BGX28_005509 [Mortierella sp. GBA30]|nr:hypothetical protein BGX28_005509 [Mortierella sp. GBA30]